MAGRSAIDVWKVTLPAPRQFAPAATDPGTVLAVSGPTKAARNETVTYTITYENRGTKPMTNVVLFNAFADSFKYVSGSSGARPNGTQVSWSLGTIAPGARGTQTVTLRVKPTAVAGAVLVNRARLTSKAVEVESASLTTAVSG